MNDLVIVTGANAGALVLYAASELQRYVRALFGLSAVIATKFEPAKAIAWLDAAAARIETVQDAQSFLLRRMERSGRSDIIAVGGSPISTLWAVYELVAQWGVQYLLHRDVMPDDPGSFHFPDVDQTWTPNLRSRCWRLINDFAFGPESWGIEENCRFIDQAAKMKFNELFLSTYVWQSFVHYEFRGVKKETGYSWFDFKYPVDGDTIGKEIFGGASTFENPDLAGITDYEERHAAARALAQGIIDHAAKRGMTVDMSVPILEYPMEFRSVLPGAQTAQQLGSRTCRPSSDQDPDDPLLVDLIRTILRAHVQTYPDVERFSVVFPEHREWLERAEDSWSKLDEKYQISEVMSLDDGIAAARQRTQLHGGAERQVTRVKGDVAMLCLLDKVLEDTTVMQRPGRTPARIIYNGMAEELMAVVPRLRACGSELLVFVDYTARRVVDQIDLLDLVPTDQVPSRFVFTLADDNVGVVPQLATEPLHTIATRLRASGWSGFMTRYWMIGDLDPTIQYLARSSWDTSITPESAYADLATRVFGDTAAEHVCKVWELIGAITDGMDRHGMGFSFPVPGMMTKHWDAQASLSPELLEDRTRYEQAWELAYAAIEHTRPAGKPDLEYLTARLRFAVLYLDTVAAVRDAGLADKEGRATDAIDVLEKALAAISQAIETYASVARDNSDRGAIAIMNEYCYRPIRDKLDDSKAGTPT